MPAASPGNLASALLAFQAEGVKLQKDAINPHFKNRYISLDSLMESVLPVLNKCGLVVLQMPTEADGRPALTTRIVHAGSGESVEATMPLQLQKTDPQSQGSAITYARRYALMAFLALVADEDTDGRATVPGATSGSAGTAGASSGADARAAASAPQTDGRDPKFATAAQSKRMFAIARSAGITNERLREILQYVTGQESSAQIPRDKYDDVIKAIELEAVPFE